MASDQIVWDIIDKQHCSFKTHTRDRTFCRNPHNLTGLCGRQTCPLANSRYATIRSSPTTPSSLTLYIKVPERAHLPSRLWEEIPLPRDYAKALATIDEQLAYWPKFTLHKCKQRLTRLTQVAIRMKRLQKEERRLGERIVARDAPKVRRREENRERKAERAAKVERAIERELVERLRSGAYGDRPLNVEEGVWERVMKGLDTEDGEKDVELDEEVEEERELEMEREAEADVEYVSDVEGGTSDEEDFGDLEDWKGGESPDEGSDDDDEHGEEEDGDSASSVDEGESEKENAEDEAQKLKKAIAGLTRKRPPQQALKKPVGKRVKGPRREIEYELETEPALREEVFA